MHLLIKETVITKRRPVLLYVILNKLKIFLSKNKLLYYIKRFPGLPSKNEDCSMGL